MSNVRLVEEFVSRWNARNGEAVAATLAPDALCIGPITRPKNRTLLKDQIIAYMELIRVEWIVANITEGANGIVFLERENRVDGDRDGERSTAVFEIRDGLIASWREYVDLTRGNPTRRSGYPVLTDAELQAVTAMLR